jgi:hypothetical protein
MRAVPVRPAMVVLVVLRVLGVVAHEAFVIRSA